MTEVGTSSNASKAPQQSKPATASQKARDASKMDTSSDDSDLDDILNKSTASKPSLSTSSSHPAGPTTASGGETDGASTNGQPVGHTQPEESSSMTEDATSDADSDANSDRIVGMAGGQEIIIEGLMSLTREQLRELVTGCMAFRAFQSTTHPGAIVLRPPGPDDTSSESGAEGSVEEELGEEEEDSDNDE